MSRFDTRTKDTFKKDIKFGTMLENYWWNAWLKQVGKRQDIGVYKPRDNGCGNDGEFIASGNTAGADFMCDISYQEDMVIEDLPVEMKWVPTAGKFTLKEGDLKAYIKEGAAILFIYNSVAGGTNLRKPQDYDFDKHISLIESKMGQIRWGIMWPSKIHDFYTWAKVNKKFKQIPYMGNKSGIIIPSQEFDHWFTQENWNE